VCLGLILELLKLCKTSDLFNVTFFTTALGDNFDLVFKKASENSVVVIPPSSRVPNLSLISILLWVKGDDYHKQGTLFTYKAPNKIEGFVEISFTETRLSALVQEDKLQYDVNIADGKWHLIGLGWTNFHIKSENEFALFYDGKLVKSAQIPPGIAVKTPQV